MLGLTVYLVSAILVGVQQHLLAVLCCLSLTAGKIDWYLLWSFEQPLLWNTWSCLLPTFCWIFLFSYQHVEKESEVTQSCLTLCNPMDCSLPGSSVRGNFQARVLEWVAISFSGGSSWPRDWTHVSHIAGRCFTVWATGKDLINQHVRELYIFYMSPWSDIFISKTLLPFLGLSFPYHPVFSHFS